MKRNLATSLRSWIARHLHTLRGASGFSLAETTIILTTMTALTATAAPSIMDYVSQARGIKVSGDVQVLSAAMVRLLFDVAHIKAGPTGQSPDLLVGAGDAVESAGGEAQPWALPMDGSRVQSLVDHLVTNDAGYPRRTGLGLFAKGWSGPYVDSVTADPWGHRYAVNIGVWGTDTAVVVLSAGPNGKVETPFRLTVFRPGGDDVLGLLGSQR